MMQYALLQSGREVNAIDLTNGTLRSNTYTCICCGNAITFVTGSYRTNAHFRHKTGESCIHYSRYDSVAQDAKDRIENRKSKFHKDWQSLFTTDATEVKVHENNKTHIADIYLQGSTLFNIETDNNTNLFDIPTKDLVIEIQHSHISVCDIKRREQFYVTENRSLVWIFDISHIHHQIEQYITVTQNKTRILFTRQQHSGLTNAVKTCKTSVILLDNGDYLFKIVDANLDSGLTTILPVSKTKFFYCLRTSNNQVTVYHNNDISFKREIRNYKDYIYALDEDIIVDIDEIVNMIEDIPVCCLREGCQMYANNAYDTYIEMVTSWLGNISNHATLVQKILKIWINHIRRTYYATETIGFGKYKYVALCDIPSHYLKWLLEENVIKNEDLEIKILELIMMDNQNTNDFFNTSSNLMYFKRCRDNYYREYWDKRTNNDRLSILESILKRPWINMIEKVIPDEEGFVRTYSYVEIPSNSCSIEKQEDIDSDDDNAYMYVYRPVQVNSKYIGISEEDLLYWYGKLDDKYYYDYKTKTVRSQHIQGYAFIDET